MLRLAQIWQSQGDPRSDHYQTKISNLGTKSKVLLGPEDILRKLVFLAVESKGVQTLKVSLKDSLFLLLFLFLFLPSVVGPDHVATA